MQSAYPEGMSEHAYVTASMRSRPVSGAARSSSQGSPLGALAVAGLCVLALAAVWSIAELVPAAHVKDATVLYRFTTLSRPGLDSIGHFLLHLLAPGLFVLWGVALIAFAVARERPRVAVAVFVVMAFAPLTSEILKPLLAHSHDQVGYVQVSAASWPSGHATAATALAMCAVLVAPSRLRGLVASLGVLFVAAVSVSLLVLAWHMPSDVLGGYLVASLWMALAVAVLRAAERRRPSAKGKSTLDARAPASGLA
jgi:membrane-associated phospholipid phosphatase